MTSSYENMYIYIYIDNDAYPFWLELVHFGSQSITAVEIQSITDVAFQFIANEKVLTIDHRLV